MLLRILTLSAAIFISFPQATTALAEDGPGRAQATMELRMKRSLEFLDAAEKAVAGSGVAEAAAMLRQAEAAAQEAQRLYSSGELELALAGFAESIRAAIDAIVLTKNSEDNTIRELVILEEAEQREAHDRQRKEAMLDKTTAEVEIFIKTAERLLSGPVGEARLGQTRALYSSSKEKSASGDLDGALEDMDGAYDLATAAVREIKRSQAEVITFPKALAEPRELLKYELRKNDTYVFFASRMIDGGEDNASKLLKAARTARLEAERSLDSGESDKAIEKLKASTELYIRAIKASGGKE